MIEKLGELGLITIRLSKVVILSYVFALIIVYLLAEANNSITEMAIMGIRAQQRKNASFSH